MSFYQRLVGGVLFPLHEKLKRHNTLAVHRELERSQWLSAAELAELQHKKLRRFLTRIAETVPYYQRLFAELSFDPQAVSSAADLQRLPLLDKATIRQHADDLKARGANQLKRFNTGRSEERRVGKERRSRVAANHAKKRRAGPDA